MALIRQDPTTKEWVIVAASRAGRPHEPVAPAQPAAAPSREGSCPFCPGNEAATPPETFRIPDARGTGWTVRVVPNKFAALSAAGELGRREAGPLFREMEGVGYHEVIVETPDHDRPTPLLEADELEQVLAAYQARYRALREDPRVKCIIIFKNHGRRAGTSLTHPHSQLVATPVAPMQIRRKYEVAIGHYDDTGRCLYGDLADAEVRAGARLVLQSERFVVFHPFASRVPFETWILPRRHQSSFGRASREDLADLARVLKRSLMALYTALGNPDFNYIVHSAPPEDENKPYYLWHIQIVPRQTAIAGFELGSGIFITTMLPEASAAVMREMIAEGDRVRRQA